MTTYDPAACPVLVTANVIGDMATLLIIKSLLPGEQRYKDIQTYVTTISEATLAARLKKLVEQNLVTRTQHAEIPPRVTYKLTPLGEALKPVIESMETFGKRIL